jgi:hypothetical protein
MGLRIPRFYSAPERKSLHCWNDCDRLRLIGSIGDLNTPLNCGMKLDAFLDASEEGVEAERLI